MFKRLAIILICLIMVFVATFGFIVGVVAVPTIYSYAEVVDDDAIYVPLRDPSDLVVSFQAYCMSRDLTVEGSIADAVTTFTTGAFNSACNTIGVDISQLQAEIKAEYDQSGKPVKFLYNSTGVAAMNRIFAQFLQDNELEVGDSNIDKEVYSGEIFIDQEGNKCLVYIIDGYYNSGLDPSNVVHGTYLKYSRGECIRLINSNNNQYDFSFPLVYASFTQRMFKSQYDAESIRYGTSNQYNTLSGSLYRTSSSNLTAYGEFCVYRYKNSYQYYPALYTHIVGNNTDNFSDLYRAVDSNSYTTQNANVFIYAPTINNNNYEGDTYITNEGDVIQEPDPVVPGGNDPGWNIGGGEGTATDGNGNTWNITFPDFELPDLNIDWSIQGLGEKFPFSIPFDLVALVNVLNAEPEAPRFEGTVNFGFTTWDYDINLEQFDTVASACRIAELLLLVFGLILITRSIIKG